MLLTALKLYLIAGLCLFALASLSPACRAELAKCRPLPLALLVVLWMVVTWPLPVMAIGARTRARLRRRAP